MNKYQKKVLIIIFILLALISFIAIIYSLFISGDTNTPSATPNTPHNTEEMLKTDIILLNDYDEFFTISKIINDYYEDITEKNINKIINLLDADYKQSMFIQANNVLNILDSNYNSVTYTPLEMYYNPDSIITYYFINGYLEDVDVTNDDRVVYKDNINFMIILNKNTKKYAITPLKNNINIEEYAKNYQLKEKELNYNTYTMVKTSINSVLLTYLNTFKNLIILDNTKAYQLLDEETKKLYSSYDEFYNNRLDIYNDIPTNIFGYSTIIEDGKNIYKIIDENQKEITIYEDSIMNFHISY